MAAAAAAGGALLVWSGIKGTKVTDTLRSLLSGQNPAAGDAYPITTPVAPPAAPGPGGAGGGPLGGSPAPLAKTGPGGTGGTLSSAQIGSLWRMAGGSAGSMRNAVCHADQESSGRTAVTSPNPFGGINVGLWQLDTQGVGAGHTVAELQDPLTNARITVQATGDGANWSEWSTPGC